MLPRTAGRSLPSSWAALAGPSAAPPPPRPCQLGRARRDTPMAPVRRWDVAGGAGAAARARSRAPVAPPLRLHIEGGGDEIAHKMEAVGAAWSFGLREEVTSQGWKESSTPPQSPLICLGSPLNCSGGETKLLASLPAAGRLGILTATSPCPPQPRDRRSAAKWRAGQQYWLSGREPADLVEAVW